MYQLNHLEDTIVAISTPLGQGGIGIVRLSGKEAVAICDEIFVSKKGKKLSVGQNFFQQYGWVICRNSAVAKQSEQGFETIDEALACVMRGPRSYTKEDVVEISCHGGTVVLRAIVMMAVDLGARLAEPGEFTKRAFLNGRIDLAQAEAVLDIIQSKTDRSLRMSLNQLKGELSRELSLIREGLMNFYTELEAVVNFPEDDIDAVGWQRLGEKIQSVRAKVDALLQTSGQGKILKEGIKVVICGKPNVGKSSLLNLLLKVPRAIVTEIAGTTRDTIEESMQIKGIPLQLIDTAGILEPRDRVEEEAIKRSRESVFQADLILFVVDGSRAFSSDDEKLLLDVVNRNLLIIINKADLPQKVFLKDIQRHAGDKRIIEISVAEKKGIEALEDAIVDQIGFIPTNLSEGVIVNNVRHIQALKECLSAIDRAESILRKKVSFEFVSEEIKLAVNFLDSITGRNIDSDLLDKIFSEFCIGK